MVRKMNFYIVCYNNYFGQSLPTERSLDTDKLKFFLESYGHQVTKIDIYEVANHPVVDDGFYIIGSHQNSEIKRYYDDIVSIKFTNRGSCIPEAKFVLAHENKGIQAILNKDLDLGMPVQTYFMVNGCEREIKKNTVYKSIGGSGSSGVFIPDGINHYKKIIKKHIMLSLSIRDLVFYTKCFIKKIIGDFNHQAFEYNRKYLRIVTQDKLKTCGYDYKVLVFGEYCFVLKRYVRKNDFRSSGSGNFEFVEAPKKLLDYCLRFREKMGVPYVSLDIMEDEGNYSCIEFQCVHFGPYTKYNADYGYLHECGNWRKVPNNKDMEELMALSINTMHGFK